MRIAYRCLRLYELQLVMSTTILKKINPKDSKSNGVVIFKFLEQFAIEDSSINGLYLNDIYLPEEIILHILSYLEPKEILLCSLVCKRWCNTAKSNALWQAIYNFREYPKKAKNLPWYVFYCYFSTDNFINLLKNGNGQDKFNNWTIISNGGDYIRIEDPPRGSDPLPEGVQDFNGCTSCFSTSFGTCFKIQIIPMQQKRLIRYILLKYKPDLSVSEWFSGRFDCACVYRLSISCTPCGNNERCSLEAIRKTGSPLRSPKIQEEIHSPYFYKSQKSFISQWEGKSWEKMEFLTNSYPSDIDNIIFGHEGQDTQFWKGHYGSKMAGGVVKFLFDSIEPPSNDFRESEPSQNYKTKSSQFNKVLHSSTEC